MERKKESVRALILNEKNELVMVRRQGYERVYPGCYELPGGKVEGKETPESAMIREVKEETGLLVRIREPPYRTADACNPYPLRIYYFICSVIGGKPSDNMHSFSRKDIGRLPLAFEDDLRGVINGYFDGL